MECACREVLVCEQETQIISTGFINITITCIAAINKERLLFKMCVKLCKNSSYTLASWFSGLTSIKGFTFWNWIVAS